MLVEGFPAGPTGTNCWVVAPAAGEECVIIDPGIWVEQALNEIVDRHRLRPVAVLLTHGHFDHTFSVMPVCGARNVPAYITPADRGQLTDPWSAVAMPLGTPMFGRLTWSEPDDVRLLRDGQVLDLAGVQLSVEAAPGHSPGQVTFRGGTDFFSGDLIFADSIGRTDFPGGSYPEMLASLVRVVLPLPDDTQIRPGHGPETTVGRERRSNMFLAEARRAVGAR